MSVVRFLAQVLNRKPPPPPPRQTLSKPRVREGLKLPSSRNKPDQSQTLSGNPNCAKHYNRNPKKKPDPFAARNEVPASVGPRQVQGYCREALNPKPRKNTQTPQTLHIHFSHGLRCRPAPTELAAPLHLQHKLESLKKIWNLNSSCFIQAPVSPRKQSGIAGFSFWCQRNH